MTQEERIKQIEEFIEEAKTVTAKPYKSPLIRLWEESVKRFLEDVYDKEMVNIFEDAMSWGAVISHDEEGQQYHMEAMQRGIEFLEGLKSKQPPQVPTGFVERSLYLQNKYDRNKQTKPQRQGAPQHHYYNYGGNFHTGQGDIEQQISVGDIILKITEEIQQKVPESQEKKSVVHALKTLTTNETFAHITGAFAGSLLSSIIPH